MNPTAAPRHFPYHHRTVAQVDRQREAERRRYWDRKAARKRAEDS